MSLSRRYESTEFRALLQGVVRVIDAVTSHASRSFSIVHELAHILTDEQPVSRRCVPSESSEKGDHMGQGHQASDPGRSAAEAFEGRSSAVGMADEIGRASCRERVEGWVGAVELEEKQRRTTE